MQYLLLHIIFITFLQCEGCSTWPPSSSPSWPGPWPPRARPSPPGRPGSRRWCRARAACSTAPTISSPPGRRRNPAGKWWGLLCINALSLSGQLHNNGNIITTLPLLSQYKINSPLLRNKEKKIEQSKTVSFLIYSHAGHFPEIHIILENSLVKITDSRYEINTESSRFSLLWKDKK